MERALGVSSLLALVAFLGVWKGRSPAPDEPFRLALEGHEQPAATLQEASEGAHASGASSAEETPAESPVMQLVDLVIREEGEERVDERSRPRPTTPSRGRSQAPLRIAYTSPEFSLVKFVEPYYPTDARGLGIEGRIVVHTLVGEDGRVRRMRVDRARELPESFAVSAQWAIRQWEFVPVVREGTARSFWVEIPVRFRIVEGVAVESS